MTTDIKHTPETWFNGGQADMLQEIAKLKNQPDRRAALETFNELNNSFMKAMNPTAAPTPGERPKTHPAIDAAIDAAIGRENGWMGEIRGMSDGQLQDRYLDRALKFDLSRNRVPATTTLAEYKQRSPDLVEIAGKFTRPELERKEVLSRLVQDRGFTVSRAKVDYERKQNPDLVKLAEANLGGVRRGGAKYHDALYAEVSSVKKTLTNAKTLGVKI